MIDLFKEFSFDAAHRLPRVPSGHKCFRLHGHTYRLVITITGSVDPMTGMVLDFKDVNLIVKENVIDHLDHQCLNEVVGLENPTCENIAMWIWHRLKRLPLKEVKVYETPTCGAVYRGN